MEYLVFGIILDVRDIKIIDNDVVFVFKEFVFWWGK